MELIGYFKILLRRKWLFIVAVIASILILLTFKFVLPSSSEISATLRVVPYTSGNPAYTQLIYADRIMNTFVEIALSSPVMKEVREELNISPNQPEDVEVQAIPETELLQITVKDQDPILARDVASAISQILMNERSIRDVRIYLVQPPEIDNEPSLFGYLYDLILALILGSALGVGLVFLAENLDTKIYSPQQVTSITNLPILGEIPSSDEKEEILFFKDKFPFFEHFRRLRTNILSLSKGKSIKTLMITSTEPGEGKSTIAANLASYFSETGRNIIIIDTDLYCSRIQDLFDLPNESGLRQVLSGTSSLSESIQKSKKKGISVLTSGASVPNQSELLESDQMDSIINELNENFDLVLIDTPAFLAISDTASLVSKVDCVLLVIKLGFAKEPLFISTLRQFENLKPKYLGLIINNAPLKIPSSYLRYYEHSIAETYQQKASSGNLEVTEEPASLPQQSPTREGTLLDQILDHHVTTDVPIGEDGDNEEAEESVQERDLLIDSDGNGNP